MPVTTRVPQLRVILLLVFGALTACQQKHVVNSHISDQARLKSTEANSFEKKDLNNDGKQARNKRYTMDKDGAPEGPLPTSYKSVKPKSEPLSRYGNPDSYRVDGETYQVMTSSKGYRARGLASWYGTKFDKHSTSSGEEYDLYALTAAHKTLPLPTYVRVKNLNNGKEAIVKVNDRGPFHKDRIIDLSYGAAVKLGLLPKGTAPVEIEALTSHNSNGKSAHYYLQAGAFSSMSLAQSLQSKITKFTTSPTHVEKYKEYFVVKMGPFATKKMTDELKSTLTNNGILGAFSYLQ